MRCATEIELALAPRPSGQTLQRWLYQELRDAMLSGRLPAGVRLPPSRELARQHGVSFPNEQRWGGTVLRRDFRTVTHAAK